MSKLKEMKPIRFIRTRLSIRSVRQILARMATVAMRYEMSSESFANILQSFIELTNRYRVKPTFPVPATVVQRHPRQFQKIEEAGVELAVHGYRHVEYTQLETSQIQMHYKQAVQTFHDVGLHINGFRFPFLRRNMETLHALGQSGFIWDSSDALYWPVLDSEHIHPQQWKSYLNILNSYQAQSIQDDLSLPRTAYGLIEIPVAIPDDDILFERLKLPPTKVRHIWIQMLEDVRHRGEMLVLQLHPERFPIFKNVLDSILKKARHDGNCWIASLGEIAQWWQERSAFSCDINKVAHGRYKVNFDCSDRGQPMVRSVSPEGIGQWFSVAKQITIKSVKKPVVGISSRSPENLKKFLADEQIIFEITDDSKRTNLYLDWKGAFRSRDKRELINQINGCAKPLIRMGRWPDPYEYCLSITGDIDGLDFWDYWNRFYG